MAKRTVRKKTPAKKTRQNKKTAAPKSVKTKTGIASTRDITAATKERKVRSERALKIYEAGVTAVQKRKFSIAAKALNEVIDEYPEEREIKERAKLYLAVCERELKPLVSEPTSLDERIYAATVSLNGGDVTIAIEHLNAVASEKPSDANVHYMLAVAHALSSDTDMSVTHLERAITLNPDNRLLARQEPDFKNIHGDDRFRNLTVPEENMDVSE
jgi:outer membrane protein assembly factor BamD (BamD/ComL family)